MKVIGKKAILIGDSGASSVRGAYTQMKQKDVEIHVRRGTNLKNPFIRVYKNGNSFKVAEKLDLNTLSYENCIIYRWGNCIQVNTKNCIIYNESTAIAAASNKKRSRETFVAQAISTPQLYTANSKNIKYPVIARPSHHQKGEDFVVLNTERDFRTFAAKHGNWYYSEFIAKDRELRVHVLFGKALSVMEKPAPKDKKAMIWNHDIVGDEWDVLEWKNYPINVCKDAVKACSALGLDHGAVDVMLKGKDSFVLEVNTSPSLINSPYNTTRYARIFDWIFRNTKDKKVNHWKTDTYKEGASYAWKNNQLDGGLPKAE